MATKVIHIKDSKGTPDEQYCGRAGKGQDGFFGNPISKGRKCPVCGEVHYDGGATLPCYKKYLDDRLAKDFEFRSRVKDLSGKTLVCFCVPAPCHCDLLKAAADELQTPSVIVREANEVD